MTSVMYQCRFTRDRDESQEQTVGWVDQKAAGLGKRVQLVDMPQSELFWTVEHVGHSMSKEELTDKQRADRKQREASDI